MKRIDIGRNNILAARKEMVPACSTSPVAQDDEISSYIHNHNKDAFFQLFFQQLELLLKPSKIPLPCIVLTKELATW